MQRAGASDPSLGFKEFPVAGFTFIHRQRQHHLDGPHRCPVLGRLTKIAKFEWLFYIFTLLLLYPHRLPPCSQRSISTYAA